VSQVKYVITDITQNEMIIDIVITEIIRNVKKYNYICIILFLFNFYVILLDGSLIMEGKLKSNINVAFSSED